MNRQALSDGCASTRMSNAVTPPLPELQLGRPLKRVDDKLFKKAHQTRLK